MTDIQPFTHELFGTIRTITDASGEAWFVAADICAALDLSNTTVALQRLDADEKSKFNLGLSGGATWCVNEAGFYSLVLASRKPEAKSFKRWVTHEVLPSIRRTGGYLTPEAAEKALTDPDFIIRLATDLKEERARRAELEAQHEADKPKVLFADSVAASRTSILVGDLAKILRGNGIQIGATRLFAWMRGNGYLVKQQGTAWNMPTQRSMELGLFEVKETAVTHSDGHVTISKTPKVTGKGQTYFVDRFLSGRFDSEEAAA
ncbi:phage antirepressor Ant [Cutibacterium avidum]|uniref:phage antirepressor n=1 Tax=Cutibacterium avidum TaxID=33010 RepID=UPI000BFC71EB|nr:phage antirepressor KilAC domain-containing protein [Cutibacterium avidum]PGX65363.1 phage antirepressor Ant [Cutibacterium avidum]